MNANAKTVYYGDVDMDGDVDQDDADLTNEYANGRCTLSAEQIIRADVDGNGEISPLDTSMIYSYINGKINTFPVEQ